MFKFIFRRLLVTLPTMFLTISIIFFGLRILPGDPAVAMLGDNATPAAVEALREEMGLNEPLWKQYLAYLGDIVQADFGESFISGESVSAQLFAVFPDTLNLTFFGIIFGCVIGIPLGIISALKRNTKIDNFLRFISIIGLSVPPFLLGIYMILAFSLKMAIFPSMGTGEGFLNQIYYLILPSLTIGLILSASVMRYTRSSMLDEINQDYIRTAWAKGIPEKLVIYKHVLRNTLIPVVTVIGLQMTGLLSGAVITESIFSRPGLGSLAIGAITTRDFPVLQGCLVLFAIAVMVVNLLVDISYSIINPRIRPS
ncbi:ABC transporter permease [Bacillus dakarensis]|uniref:ABC transporter permease n=1 Tax=Robertmurraya dakarensis TaxID=1926278 RepID=UPI000980E8AE|nr:ABC transporter permease [Bacillus dakarensis]